MSSIRSESKTEEGCVYVSETKGVKNLFGLLPFTFCLFPLPSPILRFGALPGSRR
jgi:hypothetical protein